MTPFDHPTEFPNSSASPAQTATRTVASAELPLIDSAAAEIDPRVVAQGVYVTVHGHFYQPPRENPYLDAIERQPSAAPFHNWNERIHHECYRPNAFARVLNDRGELLGIVNNFEYLSFNIGPTLMSWLEQYDLETYQRILAADRKSCERLNGHGNAIAQAYNHMILPLANERDKLTQIRWGKADFKARFGRDPEGLWLAETAVDYSTLEVLVAEGIKFIVLAPSQAQRCRPLPIAEQPNPDWIEVGGGQIDPVQPYRCYLKSADSEPKADQEFSQESYIDIFFYDGPISRDMGFNDLLSNSQHLAGRLAQAVRGDQRTAQLISVATDGETFGHHKGGTEKALAYAFMAEFPRRGWQVTNYAHYLSLSPPRWQVELKPVTAWSCSHGVDRWQADCGCGGGGGWHQRWRKPLRESLDWLRDQLIKLFEEQGRKLFRDPWEARDQYIQVMLNRSPVTINRFLSQHQTSRLSPAERSDALRLLEMQRHSLLMYTSCGWFFDEISRPEGVQVLQYAARAIELAGDVAGLQLEKSFIRKLGAAPSNVELFQTGAEVYRQLVSPTQISLEQVAAHYAMTSLFTPYARDQRVYCYEIHQLDYQMQRLGTLTLAVGQIQLTSEMTRDSKALTFAVLHLGGWDFHCCVQSFSGRRAYGQLKELLFETLSQASAAQIILAMSRQGGQCYSLRDLFAEERHKIMRLLNQETLTRLDQLYMQVYRDNYSVLAAFHRDGLEVPQELQVAAEIAIGLRATTALQSLERERGELPLSDPQVLGYLTELEAIATEAVHLRCHLNPVPLKQSFERLILQALWDLSHDTHTETVEAELAWITRLLDLAKRLQLQLSMDRAQEAYFQALQPLLQQLTLQQLTVAPTKGDLDWSPAQIQQFLQLGQRLAIDLRSWIDTLNPS